MRLYLIRHAETAWNLERRTQGGRSDIELNETGIAQTVALAEYLGKEQIAAVYSSPLQRALITARAIAETHGLTPVVQAELTELDQGEMEGLTSDEMRAKYPEVMRRWGAGDTTVPLPGGESLGGLQERMWSGIREIYQTHRQETVVVVGHNLAILMFICKALGLPPSSFRRLRMQPGALNAFEMNEQGVTLLRFNQTYPHDSRSVIRNTMEGA